MHYTVCVASLNSTNSPSDGEARERHALASYNSLVQNLKASTKIHKNDSKYQHSSPAEE